MVLGLVVGAFLFSGCEAGKVKQLQSEVTDMNQVIQQKDVKIKTLINQAQSKEKELAGVKEELDNTKKELDVVKQKVSVSTPALASEPTPAPAPAPASEPTLTPESATESKPASATAP